MPINENLIFPRLLFKFRSGDSRYPKYRDPVFKKDLTRKLYNLLMNEKEKLNFSIDVVALVLGYEEWILEVKQKDSTLRLSFTCNLVTEDSIDEIDSAHIVRMVATHYWYKDYHKESESTELTPIGPWHSSDSGGLVPNDEMLIGSDMFFSFIFWCVDEYLMYL